jgi:hypothetical protein
MRVKRGVSVRSIVALCGVSDYDSSTGLPQIPQVLKNLEVLGNALASQLVVEPPAEVRILSNPTSSDELAAFIVASTRDAEDLLLAYYSGHGLLNSQGQLCLSHAKTKDAEFEALDYAKLERAMRYSPARRRIIILDCCYSGAVTVQFLGSDDLAGAVQIPGAYVLTSSPFNEPSHVRQGEETTAFTGRLSKVITETIQKPVFSLNSVVALLRTTLESDNLPRPTSVDLDGLGNTDLFRSRRGSVGLAVSIKQQRDTREAASQVINEMLAVARVLEHDEEADRFTEILRGIYTDTIRMIVMGRFKAGKSTLSNALLVTSTNRAQGSEHKGPLVTDMLPSTAALTCVTYSESPWAKAYMFDGDVQQWTWERYLDESPLGIDEEENWRRLGKLREFEIGYPSQLCHAGVVVFDTPGLDDNPLRTQVTLEASKRSDVALFIASSNALLGQSEMSEMGELRSMGIPTFLVVNMYAGLKPDERIRTFVWNRFVRDHLGGAPYEGQPLSSQGTYFVDAHSALLAKVAGDESRILASGLKDLEEGLAHLLTVDRERLLLRRWITAALDVAANMISAAGAVEMRQSSPNGILLTRLKNASSALGDLLAKLG